MKGEAKPERLPEIFHCIHIIICHFNPPFRPRESASLLPSLLCLLFTLCIYFMSVFIWCGQHRFPFPPTSLVQ